MFRRSLVCLFVLLCAVGGPRPARAFDWSADTTRILGDPAFLPLTGQVAGAFSTTRSSVNYDYLPGLAGTFPPGIVPDNAWSKTGTLFQPAISYGVTDDLAVSVSLAWGNVRSRDTYTVNQLVYVPAARTASVSLPVAVPTQPLLPQLVGLRPGSFVFVPTKVQALYYSNGTENPVVQVAWRVVDQRSAPVNVDLTAGYAPDVFPARDPGGETSGTLALGGQRGTLQASVSRETRFLTVLGYAAFGYDGRLDIGQPGGSEVLRDAPHADYALGVQAEARVLRVLALNFGVGAQKSAAFHVQTISADFPFTEDTDTPGVVVSPYVGIVVPALHDHVAVELLYQHDFIGDETVSTPSGPPDRYSHQESDLFVARLLFRFGLL